MFPLGLGWLPVVLWFLLHVLFCYFVCWLFGLCLFVGIFGVVYCFDVWVLLSCSVYEEFVFLIAFVSF